LTCHSLGNGKTCNIIRRRVIFFPEASRSIEISTVFDAAANARFSPGVSLLSESEKVITSRPIKRIILGKRLIRTQFLIKAAKTGRIDKVVGYLYLNFRFWEIILGKLIADSSYFGQLFSSRFTTTPQTGCVN
jgi:hypothetical protein